MACLLQKKSTVWLVLGPFLAMVMACALIPAPAPSMPDWVSRGSGAFQDAEGPIFQGTGSAQEMGNASLLRAAADNLAKAQLAGVLDLYLTALVQFAGFDHSEVETRQALNAMLRQALDQAVIADHWFDQSKHSLHARCVLKLEDLKHVLNRAGLRDGMGTQMAARADHVFTAFVVSRP